MTDDRRKAPALVLFLLFTVLWFGTIFTINVIQSGQNKCGLGNANVMIEDPAEFKHFYERYAPARSSAGGDRSRIPGCGRQQSN